MKGWRNIWDEKTNCSTRPAKDELFDTALAICAERPQASRRGRRLARAVSAKSRVFVVFSREEWYSVGDHCFPAGTGAQGRMASSGENEVGDILADRRTSR